ncbi:S1 family peptidase [Vibrio aquimaris]|uniref:Trypsin-like protease n=1 Tax=Vibrio aquimaris TaxID=2587862 RepID=A0A5P9CJ36_9VIBR|nr:serine protease [Vibrio aquimaris]QFT25913.1 Trypsin-like protease precursor [Vibrio aquimaris]
MQKSLIVLAMGLCTPFFSVSSEVSAVDDAPAPRIIGGSATSKNDWPFMAAMVAKFTSDTQQGQFCGASFIGGRYVLTAAHCVNGIEADEFDVAVGVHDLSHISNEGQRIAVRSYYMHQDYNERTMSNDIAIVELEHPVASPQVKVAEEVDVNNLNSGDTLTVTGWGRQDAYNPLSFSKTLFKVDVPFVDKGTCQNLGLDYFLIGDDAICAGDLAGGKDSCQGDSGGPLMTKIGNDYKQVGVVSWGLGCGNPNAPGVYANVGHFEGNGWIEKNTANVSYTQNTILRDRSGQHDVHLPITNFSAEAFNVTDITLPAGVSLIANNCSTTLNASEVCSIDVRVDASVALASSDRATLKVDTNHSVAGDLLMNIVYADAKPQPSSGGSKGGSLSLAMMLLALFGLVLRGRERHV